MEVCPTQIDHGIVKGKKTLGDGTNLPKKRGRKPKGGKIINIITPDESVDVSKPSIIIHLKCGLADLKHIDNYVYCPTNVAEKIDTYQFKPGNVGCELDTVDDAEPENDTLSVIDVINQKLKTLAHDLHSNNISDKKSACFWCTCDFDNPPIYIPKHYINDMYHVYGCFCSPECSAGHLFKQSDIDPSTKFERYALLNNIYCKIYNYEKNIKPAPDPHYTLDKFYGNLSIQEYRQLLKNERLLLIVDKPLMRTLPELHEDNDDFIINNQLIGEKYKLKRNIKKQSKSEIMQNNFNMKT